MSINKFTTALMPVSQAVSWLALIQSIYGGTSSGSSNKDDNRSSSVYTALSLVSSFYCGWALYKVYGQGDKRELGQYSMGLTALATLAQSKFASLGAIALSIVNFGFALYLVFPMGNAKLAKAIKGTDSKEGITWAIIFKGYLLSGTVFWSFAFNQVLTLP